MEIKNKVFIYELDSGSWNVIKPLLEKGKLPHLQMLMNQGVYGILKSDKPFISPRIWTTIFTGKHSNKHGVEFFASTSSMVKQKRLWDILLEKNIKTGVFGSLVTWPPKPVNGFIIPGILSQGTDTYPREYQALQELALGERKKLKNKEEKGTGNYLKDLINKKNRLKNIGVTGRTFRSAFRYLAGEKLLGYKPEDRYFRKASLYLRMTVDVFLHLYNKYKPGFVTFHNHLCDAVSHRYWNCYEPEKFKDIPAKLQKKFKNVIPNTYILTDRLLGDILARLDHNTNIFVISDHGSKAIAHEVKPHSLNFKNFLQILNLTDVVIPSQFGFTGILYFTDGKLKDQMVKTIQSISFQENGEKIFKVEITEKYLTLDTKPRLWRRKFTERDKIKIEGYGVFPFFDIFSKKTLKITGIHAEEGIIIARGPDIKQGGEITGASVFDITPTILALMGLPVASDMDGKVLSNIIKEEWLTEHPVQHINTYETGIKKEPGGNETVDIEKVKSRLTALGYL